MGMEKCRTLKKMKPSTLKKNEAKYTYYHLHVLTQVWIQGYSQECNAVQEFNTDFTSYALCSLTECFDLEPVCVRPESSCMCR